MHCVLKICIDVSLLFLDLKVNTRQGNAKERIDLFLFKKCKRKSY